MVAKTLLTAWTVALGASSLAAAQNDNLRCDLKKAGDSWECPANPALATSISCDFREGACDHFEADKWGTVKYTNDGAEVILEKRRQAPTLVSKEYIFFGRIEFKVRCAPGAGVVSSAILLSDVGDEIDFEWIGSDTERVQSNYFGKNNNTVWDRGQFHPVQTPASIVHTYAIEWTKEQVKWFVNNAHVRTLKYEEAVGGVNFPQTPSQIRLGIWAPETTGIQSWAGGAANFDEAPFVATYESITVVDYAGGDKPAQGGIKEYVISDKSASYKSVKVVKEDDTAVLDHGKAGKATSKVRHDSSSSKARPAASTTSKSNAESTTSAMSNATVSMTKGSRTSSTSAAAIPTALSGAAAAPKSDVFGHVLSALAGFAVAQLWL